MKVLMLLLGILLLTGASVLTYLLYDNNKSSRMEIIFIVRALL